MSTESDIALIKRHTVYEAPKRPKAKVCHPMIRLSGKYLTAFEFNIGDTYELTLEKGKITIIKVPYCHSM